VEGHDENEEQSECQILHGYGAILAWESGAVGKVRVSSFKWLDPGIYSRNWKLETGLFFLCALCVLCGETVRV
jgi:hypothetical protein